MITIDIVMPTGGSHGGVENAVKSWVRHLNPSRFTVRVFHISPGKEDYLEGYDKQWVLPLPDDVDTLTVKYCAEAYLTFLKELGAPDLCVAAWIPILSKACAVARKVMKLQIPVISWIHGDPVILERIGWDNTRDMLFADAHLCISGKIESALRSANPDAVTFMIGNPVTATGVIDYHPDDRTLCYVSRLVYDKRTELALEALTLAKSDEWKLLIAGDGPESERLQSMAKTLSLADRVSFLGWQNPPWPACSNAHGLVITSAHEGFSLAALEASGIGMTVISTPVSGCTDYIVPGQNGFFFAHDDARGLADILDAISDGVLSWCDPAVCKESITRFSEKNYFEQLPLILERLCET